MFIHLIKILNITSFTSVEQTSCQMHGKMVLIYGRVTYCFNSVVYLNSAAFCCFNDVNFHCKMCLTRADQ